MSGLPDLRDFVRPNTGAAEITVLLRGGPDSAEKLAVHAQRLGRAFVLDGNPVLGVSVFAALDDIGYASQDGILSGKLATYRLVHHVLVGDLHVAGFTVLPTFGRPHMTVVVSGLDRVEPLLEVFGSAHANPHYGEMVRRRRG